MTFDYWVELSKSARPPDKGELPASPEEAAWNLASGFVDRCAEWAMCGDDQRIESRNRYIEEVTSKERVISKIFLFPQHYRFLGVQTLTLPTPDGPPPGLVLRWALNFLLPGTPKTTGYST
jgi:hypothetical protein